jgi:hypothetical protein
MIDMRGSGLLIGGFFVVGCDYALTVHSIRA